MKRLFLLLLMAAPLGANVSITKITAAQVSFGSSYTINSPGSVSAGDTVVFIAALNGDGAQGTAALTDSAGGNTYTQRFTQTSGGNNAEIVIFDSTLATGLTSSSHWTFTPQTDGQWNVLIYDVSGASATPYDTKQSNAVTNTTNAATTSNLTPATQPEGAIAAAVATVAFSAYGNIIGSAATGLDNTTAMGGRVLMTEWRRITATTAGVANFTIGAGGDGAVALWTYEESGGGGGPVPSGSKTKKLQKLDAAWWFAHLGRSPLPAWLGLH